MNQTTKQSTSRRSLIIANWKLNGGIDLMCTSIATLVGKEFDTDIAVCPPYIYIRDMLSLLHHSEVQIGSQNISKFESGAYTGETSAEMLKKVGCSLCLIGHSERRQMFRENNISCNIKVQNALAHGLLPVLCIGENAEEKEAGITKDIIFRQIDEGLKDIEPNESNVCLAYEPVWAIGSGQSADPELVQEIHQFIRECLAEKHGTAFSQKTRILYGGSVSRKNACELLEKPDIDGLLVGGASLDPEHFLQICTQCELK
ncbi:triose-phosphate isomerase [Gilvimarinus agarilyticus]|uniref:triose-phosphate isomerase n=1 Tax=Gilvimarinus sp. 2_MG-2023 TaxID=3062666 RepID=UPI001C08C497|nr:triose-phosphate isomerase [Gilvimarinus sp. 2_MG-2023]MBU2886705.1 triose-phosphate isomerase [Gilvimarinus agarilyticus]MDO6571371.1 triose-phosphate isomerase [Gilvimarinus sp. 2_MG-2023]